MRILLVGSEPRTAASLRAIFSGEPFTVVRCASIAGAVVECTAACRQYDWIILERQSTLREGAELSRALPSLNRRGPVAILGLERGALPGLSLVCGAQESPLGIKLLRCELSRPGALEPIDCIHRGRGVIIEYQASAKRINGRCFAALKIRRPELTVLGCP